MMNFMNPFEIKILDVDSKTEVYIVQYVIEGSNRRFLRRSIAEYKNGLLSRDMDKPQLVGAIKEVVEKYSQSVMT